MIRVTADIFSGRPNPSWVLEDDHATAILKDVRNAPAAAAPLDSGFQGLGNRGLVVELLDDRLQSDHGLPATFRIGGGEHGHGLEIAEKLTHTMSTDAARHPAAMPMHDAIPLEADLRAYIFETLPGKTGSLVTHESAPQAASAPLPPLPNCLIETSKFNPGFWNDPAHIGKNNCYAYAANRRTDTFPQPGRASGHMYAAINCNDVRNGAVSDGANLNCAPSSEAPRWFMALVIAPGPGFVDYHWYRKATEGFWGHKPGGTAARNVDNSGHIVNDPRTANRGPYTIFCCFMFAQKRMRIS